MSNNYPFLLQFKVLFTIIMFFLYELVMKQQNISLRITRFMDFVHRPEF
jgi:hypothetical protein